MAVKAVLIFASAVLIQSIYGQCVSVLPNCSSGSGSGVVSGSSTNSGGAFLVSSAGPVAPRGLAAATDNIQLSGNLAVDGALPFLSAVAFEGQFPNQATAAVAYGCGDGNIAITKENGGCGARL